MARVQNGKSFGSDRLAQLPLCAATKNGYRFDAVADVEQERGILITATQPTMSRP